MKRTHKPYENTTARDWARKRNLAIWRIRGMKAQVGSMNLDKVLTFEEITAFHELEARLGVVIGRWHQNNIASKRDFFINKGGN